MAQTPPLEQVIAQVEKDLKDDKDAIRKIRNLKKQITAKIEKLNTEYAVVNLAGDTAVLHEIKNPVTGEPDVEFSQPTDFHQFLANQLVDIPQKNISKETKKIPISKLWFVSAKRRQFKGVAFNPDNPASSNGYYNLFRGFGVQPQKGDWSLMRLHIREVIAKEDERIYTHVLAWAADMFQNPGGERPGVALVIRGPQGIGKGAFASNIGKIIGSHFIHVSDQNHFIGRFNQHLKDKLLVFVDEGIWAGDKSIEGKIKAYITEGMCLVEPKGVNPFTVRNHMRFIIASNNDWVVPAGFDERRMFVVDASDKYQRDYEYFNKLFKQMDNGGREAMLYDLLKYDYSALNLKEFPRTEALLDQILRTQSVVARFWFEKLKEGALDPQDSYWAGEIAVQEFYDTFIDYSRKLGWKYAADKGQFGKELRDFCPPMKKVRKRVSAIEREMRYTFPDLETCQALYEKKVNIAIDWSGIEDDDAD